MFNYYYCVYVLGHQQNQSILGIVNAYNISSDDRLALPLIHLMVIGYLITRENQ